MRSKLNTPGFIELQASCSNCHRGEGDCPYNEDPGCSYWYRTGDWQCWHGRVRERIICCPTSEMDHGCNYYWLMTLCAC